MINFFSCDFTLVNYFFNYKSEVEVEILHYTSELQL